MTDQRRDFANYYIESRRIRESAIKAGYSPHTAHVQGSRLLKDPEIKEYVETTLLGIYEANIMGISEAVSILTDIARTSPEDIYHKDGTLKPMHEIPKFAQHAIEGIEHETHSVWDEMLEKFVTVTIPKKVKLTGKQAAIDKILKYAGGYKMDNEQKRPDPIVLNLNPLNEAAKAIEETVD